MSTSSIRNSPCANLKNDQTLLTSPTSPMNTSYLPYNDCYEHVSLLSMRLEPLLTENPNHFVLFPIKHNDIWHFYKQAQASLWTAEEIDLTSDHLSLETLTQAEGDYIYKILAFFAASNGIVNENLCQNFATEVQYPEACCFYLISNYDGKCPQ